MTINSRQKGARGERQFAEKLREIGFPGARRASQFRGGAVEGSESADAITGVHWEVKRTNRLRLREAMEQASDDCWSNEDTRCHIPAVAHKADRQPWLVTIRADDLVAFCRRVLEGLDNGKGDCP